MSIEAGTDEDKGRYASVKGKGVLGSQSFNAGFSHIYIYPELMCFSHAQTQW
jgi:hypothetical protein